MHPTNPDLSRWPRSGTTAAPNADRGVFRSTDGGKTWEKVLFRDDKTGRDRPRDRSEESEIVYAALWEAWRKPWEMSSGGPGSGLFKSTDGGDNWTELTRKRDFRAA